MENILAILLTLSSLAGFLLYQTGQTRAKNCAHTSVLLLLGVVFGWVGYWVGGFAVQTGGIGDAHAALALPLAAAEQSALDHELSLNVLGHHWGLMGSSGFFLETDSSTQGEVAALFLSQAVLLAMTLAAALSGALERGRLLAMAVVAFVIGAIIYPLLANWIWGGGWLAELGREFGLGHGVVDLAGAGVVHETAGVIALAITVVLGPRQGRFTRNKITGIPGHNVPFTLVGSFLLLVAWVASAVVGVGGISPSGASAGLAAANVLLGAAGAVLISVFVGAWRKQRANPARLTRALLCGAVSLCGGSAFFDPWAAFVIGLGAGLLVDFMAARLVQSQVDDPVNAVAIHLTGGIWGLLAVGLFANGVSGQGLNGISFAVRGLFFGGRWYQLAAQALGSAADFVVVFVLAYFLLHVVQKILGDRVPLRDELQGLDWIQVGALGYQPDVESDDITSSPD